MFAIVALAKGNGSVPMDNLVGKTFHRRLLRVDGGNVFVVGQPGGSAPGRDDPWQCHVVMGAEVIEFGLEIGLEGLNQTSADIKVLVRLAEFIACFV